MKVKLRYFGMVEEVTGKAEEEVNSDSNTIQELKELLDEKYPGLKGMNIKIALDQEIATGEEILNEGSEISLLPPFAGG